MRRMVLAFCALLSFVAAAATPTITGVTAQQRYPWNGKVDISYTVTGDITAEAKQRALITSLKVTATDRDANATYTATKLSGDRTLTAGTHKFVWDLDAEGLSFKSSNVVFKVSCETTPALYCVIDLSAGANATSYPVTYLASPPSGGFNVDAYKTTKLVLRRIEAGSFMMGDDAITANNIKINRRHNVILTKSFLIGIFEVTQKHYTLVMGSNPSEYKGDKRPVEKVSYEMIRGSSEGKKWPASTDVDATSFMGLLRIRTGLEFDLPTEAQWEYACRAGTTSRYNDGSDATDNMKKLGRYYGNTSDGKGGYLTAHTTVGSYLANSWGLYDMHGNVEEWCLDRYMILSDEAVTDPVGATSATDRVYRGGAWRFNEVSCMSPYRGSNGTSGAANYFGFRLARTLAN